MTATVDIATVTNSIASLSIADVTILDVDEIPDAIGLDAHVLCPLPVNFISNVEITRSEISGQKLDLKYTLIYRYFHCPIGSGGLIGNYSNLIAKIGAILVAFASDATLSGAMDNLEPTIPANGVVFDGAGKEFWGFDISLRIHQFLEV